VNNKRINYFFRSDKKEITSKDETIVLW